MGLKIVTVLALPIAVIVLLRAAPSMDARWEDQPAHFWIVLVAGVVNAGLAVAVSEAGRRRKDARLLLIGLAFLASAGFLGLHALATPGVLLEKGNAGFVLATPVGLVVAGLLAAASAIEYPLRTALAIVRHARALVGAVLALLGLWAVLSLAELPPLRATVAPEDAEAALGRVRADRRRGVRVRGRAVLPDRGAAQLQARLRDRVRLRAAGRVARDRARVAHDELAAELVGVAPADGDQLLHDRRRRAAGVVRGALQRALPRRDARRASAR